MIKGFARVGSASPGEKNGISVIELREAFATFGIKPGSFSSDIPDQGCFNGWCQTNQFFFSPVAAFVGDICLVGIFCFAESPAVLGMNAASPSPVFSTIKEAQRVPLGGGF